MSTKQQSMPIPAASRKRTQKLARHCHKPTQLDLLPSASKTSPAPTRQPSSLKDNLSLKPVRSVRDRPQSCSHHVQSAPAVHNRDSAGPLARSTTLRARLLSTSSSSRQASPSRSSAISSQADGVSVSCGMLTAILHAGSSRRDGTATFEISLGLLRQVPVPHRLPRLILSPRTPTHKMSPCHQVHSWMTGALTTYLKRPLLQCHRRSSKQQAHPDLSIVNSRWRATNLSHPRSRSHTSRRRRKARAHQHPCRRIPAGPPAVVSLQGLTRPTLLTPPWLMQIRQLFGRRPKMSIPSLSQRSRARHLFQP
jgi:hypothetical protein